MSTPIPEQPTARRRISGGFDPARGPLIPRLLNALFLRQAFYDAVAADRQATGPAGAVVCLAAMARESVGLYTVSQEFSAWGLLLALIVVFALARWLVYTAVMYPIARWLGGRPVGYVRLLRCLGFAETPAVLLLLNFTAGDELVPWITFAVGVWLLLATIVAVRAAAAVPLARAAVIGVLGFAAYLALGVVVDAATRLGPEPAGAPAALTLQRSV